MKKTELSGIVDTLYKLREQRKAIDDQIKSLEKPFKELLDDNESIEGDLMIATMHHTTRLTCEPEELWDALGDEEAFFRCVSVQNAKAEKELGEEPFKAICDEVPYQKRLDFVTKEAMK